MRRSPGAIALTLALLTVGPAWADDVGVERVENLAHTLGVRADFGAKEQLGFGYVRLYERGRPFGIGALTWSGWGADLKLILGGAGIEAGTVAAIARAGGMGCTGGFGLEGALGMGVGQRLLQGVGSVGVFVSVMFAELGYQFQFPLFPFRWPSWLRAHFFGVRLHLPVARYGYRATPL